jgi:hypothetical protein
MTTLYCRKMYNEALMVRKVKSYLSSISVNTDEEALQRLSIEIEPPQVGYCSSFVGRGSVVFLSFCRIRFRILVAQILVVSGGPDLSCLLTYYLRKV